MIDGNDMRSPFAPIAQPVILTEGGFAVVPHPSALTAAILPVARGLHLGWAPVETNQVLLPLFVGYAGEAGIATIISREGLQAMIADLQSIEAQL